MHWCIRVAFHLQGDFSQTLADGVLQGRPDRGLRPHYDTKFVLQDPGAFGSMASSQQHSTVPPTILLQFLRRSRPLTYSRIISGRSSDLSRS